MVRGRDPDAVRPFVVLGSGRVGTPASPGRVETQRPCLEAGPGAGGLGLRLAGGLGDVGCTGVSGWEGSGDVS